MNGHVMCVRLVWTKIVLKRSENTSVDTLITLFVSDSTPSLNLNVPYISHSNALFSGLVRRANVLLRLFLEPFLLMKQK